MEPKMMLGTTSVRSNVSKNPTQGISLQIGIQLAHFTFDKCPPDTKTFPYESASTIELEIFGAANTSHIIRTTLSDLIWKSFDFPEKVIAANRVRRLQEGECIRFYDGPLKIGEHGQKLINVSLVHEELLNFSTIEENRKARVFVFNDILVAVVIVRVLYAGTLVAFWTTAPSHPKRRSSSALLATFCIFLATLTIASRCYASKNATHPLAQLSSQPQALSSITTKDSKFQAHSSKLVLSRFFRLPFKDTQSDTRIILRNSKKLLSTQNFKIVNATNLNENNRRRRELNVYKKGIAFNDFDNYEDKYNVNENSPLYQVSHSKTRITTAHPYVFNNSNKKWHIPSRNLEVEGQQSVKFRTNKNSNFLRNHSDLVTSVNRSDSASVNSSVSGTLQIIHRQNDLGLESLAEEKTPSPIGSGIERPMPPVLDHSNNSFSSESAVLVLVVSAVVLTVALGLVTCVLSHYRGGTAADPHDAGQTPTTAPMLSVVSAGAAAGVGGMDRLRSHGAAAREIAASRERQVRLHAVHTDIAINLPPSIALPDGEDHPFNNSRLQIRDSEQESEIYQKCIKPPPNRTVLESESPPPYRSSSAGLLGSIGSSSSGSSDWSGGSAPLVMRCHSMSSTSKRPEAGSSGQKTDFIQRTVKIFTGKKSQPPPAPTLPVVVVPTRQRQTSEQQNSSARPKPSV